MMVGGDDIDSDSDQLGDAVPNVSLYSDRSDGHRDGICCISVIISKSSASHLVESSQPRSLFFSLRTRAAPTPLTRHHFLWDAASKRRDEVVQLGRPSSVGDRSVDVWGPKQRRRVFTSLCGYFDVDYVHFMAKYVCILVALDACLKLLAVSDFLAAVLEFRS